MFRLLGHQKHIWQQRNLKTVRVQCCNFQHYQKVYEVDHLWLENLLDRLKRTHSRVGTLNGPHSMSLFLIDYSLNISLFQNLITFLDRKEIYLYIFTLFHIIYQFKCLLWCEENHKNTENVDFGRPQRILAIDGTLFAGLPQATCFCHSRIQMKRFVQSKLFFVFC